jgi:acetylornithine aminotransferase
MYRCGTYPFAFQHAGIVPDVVTMAKGIAGGVPMGACSAPAHVAAVFEPGIHGSTFGGSCLAITAANTVLDTVAAEGIAENVTETGAYLREKLAALPQVVEVRGKGLMVAAELKEGLDANAIVLAALEAGLVLNATGPHTLRFLPPLVCARKDVDALIERLAALL